jgi:hypothetical protein
LDRAKAKKEAEIKKWMVDKGGIVLSGIASEMLLDIHGCYEKGKAFMGALGGTIQQWYYVVNAILKIYNTPGDLLEYFNRVRKDPASNIAKKALAPRELMLEQFFTPFMVIAIKELKTDFLQIINSPQSQKLLDSFKIPLPALGNGYDLSKLTREQYI